MTVGERIKHRREELHMSQEELAKQVGYKSRSSINKIELSRELPLRKIELVAAALSTTPSELMGWSEDAPDQEKAMELYILYQKAIPEVQGAVDALLRSHKTDA